MKKNWMKYIILGLAFLAIILIMILNIIYLSDMSHWEIPNIELYGIKNILMSLLAIALIVLIAYLANHIQISKKLKITTLIILLAGYALIQILWINITTEEQFADSLEVIRIADNMVNNKELSEYQTNYLQYYPQQLTMAVVFANIFKIFGTTDYKILEILNAICNLFTILGLYAILKNFQQNYRINKILFFVLTLTFIPIILLVSFVYGDFIGLACAVWSIYCTIKYTKKEKIKWIILSRCIIKYSLFSKNELLYFCNSYCDLSFTI